MGQKTKVITILGLITVLFFLFVGSYNSWTNVKAASGSTTKACKHEDTYTRGGAKDCTTGGMVYEICSDCGTTLNSWKEDPPGHRGGRATCVKGAVCSNCGEVYTNPNSNNHDWGDWQSLGNDITDQHKRVCKRSSQHVETGTHNWNESHVCTVCDVTCVVPASHHYFPGGVGRKCEVCPVKLSVSGQEVLGTLPLRYEYTMIGNPNQMSEKSLTKITLVFNYTPYINKTGSEIVDMDFTYASYEHANYATHVGAYNNLGEGAAYASELSSKGFDVKDDFAKGNVDTSFGWWGIGQLGSWLSGGTITGKFTGSGTTYTLNLPGSGHYWTLDGGGLHITGMETLYDMRLFCNGGCSLNTMGNSTKIYGMVRTTYRDTDGNRIPGAPEDSIQTKLVYQLGEQNRGVKVTSTANHPILDPLGWRYKGYKIYKAFNVPSGAVPSPEGSSDSVSVTPSFGDQKYTIVFIYEPVLVTVQHVNRDRTLINTTKNGTYKLPELISKSANPNHQCNVLGCNGVGSYGSTAVHYNTSLNKYLWPGYILTDYAITNSERKCCF